MNTFKKIFVLSTDQGLFFFEGESLALFVREMFYEGKGYVRSLTLSGFLVDEEIQTARSVWAFLCVENEKNPSEKTKSDRARFRAAFPHLGRFKVVLPLDDTAPASIRDRATHDLVMFLDERPATTLEVLRLEDSLHGKDLV